MNAWENRSPENRECVSEIATEISNDTEVKVSDLVIRLYGQEGQNIKKDVTRIWKIKLPRDSVELLSVLPLPVGTGRGPDHHSAKKVRKSIDFDHEIMGNWKKIVILTMK
jgi:hypothetical protein